MEKTKKSRSSQEEPRDLPAVGGTKQQTSSRQKRALQEITNVPKQKRQGKKNRASTDDSEDVKEVEQVNESTKKRSPQQDPEIFGFQRTLSNSLIQSIKQVYERDDEISIITDVTVSVPSILFAREAFATIGTTKFSSQFLERRAISSSEEFMSWMKVEESHRTSVLKKVQFEKADVIMSSTELTIRVWLTRKSQITTNSPPGTRSTLRSTTH
jgi:hypothetical protein